MDDSFEFKLNLYTRMLNTLKTFSAFSDADERIIEQDEKSFLFEIVDILNKVDSKDDIFNLEEEWAINTLSRLIEIMKKYGTKKHMKNMDDTNQFKESLYKYFLNEMQNNSFWSEWLKGNVDLGQDNESGLCPVRCT